MSTKASSALLNAYSETDPEFVQRFGAFAFEQVPHQAPLDSATQMLTILSALLGCQGIAAFRALVPSALEAGLTAVQLKEMIYQATAYLGIGRVLPFLQAANDELSACGVTLPLPGQQTTTDETRLADGAQAQVEIFGEHMRDFYCSGPEETRHINRWLAENCFGDYYTRTGLDYRQRELITFCFLAAQGGCEPQLTSHIATNLRLGNDRALLIRVLSQCLPYIGYPRSLNALHCIEAASR